MADAPLRSIKPLCTASEFTLLMTTVGRPLAAQSPAQLRRTISLLRGVRDKWRSQTTAQRRRERPTRGGNAMLTAGRSEAKERAFAEAIVRVEAMIDRSGAPSRRRSPKAATPATRSAEHRLERARTRKALRRTLGVDTAVAGRGVKRASGAAETRRRAAAIPVKAPTKPARKASPSKTAAGASAPPTRGRGIVKGSRAPAEAAARARRIRDSGLDTRVKGHVKARGRRDQARRDRKRAAALGLE